MKIIVTLFFMVSMSLFADEVEELNLPDDSTSYYNVTAIGLSYDYLFEIYGMNRVFSSSYFEKSDLLKKFILESPIPIINGQAITNFPWVKSMRVGAKVGYGKIESEILEENNFYQETNMVQRSFSTLMFSLSAHYAYVPYENFALLAGFDLGYGSMNLKEYFVSTKYENGFYSSNDNGFKMFEKSFLFTTPSVQVEYSVTSYLAVRAEFAYNITISQNENWTFNILGTQSDLGEFDLSSYKLGLGIIVGIVDF
jgi:hypothetical protein